MAYNLKWSPNHPGHIVYLIDYSGSMGWEENKRINKLLDILSVVCDRLIANDSMNAPLDNGATVSMFGYNSEVFDLFFGDFKKLDQYLDTQSPLFKDNPKAKPQWQTYMADAFDSARRDIEQWIEKQKQSGKPIPAPIVINITDGIPEEGDNDPNHTKAMARAKTAAQKLMDVSVPDGNVLLFNIHIMEGGNPLVFPSSRPSNPNHPEQQFLFDISSQLNEDQIACARGKQIDEAQHGSRFMATSLSDYNKLLRLIEFGSTVSQLSNTRTEQVKQ